MQPTVQYYTVNKYTSSLKLMYSSSFFLISSFSLANLDDSFDEFGCQEVKLVTMVTVVIMFV
mgnify:CR=1 FL=1